MTIQGDLKSLIFGVIGMVVQVIINENRVFLVWQMLRTFNLKISNGKCLTDAISTNPAAIGKGEGVHWRWLPERIKIVCHVP